MSHTKILLAEDDKKLGMILKAYLDANGFPTVLCMNAEEAKETFLTTDFDLCIIDIMAEDFVLVEQLKKVNLMVPVIILSAKTSPDEVLEGFQAGADDYMTKPFSMDELLARLRVWQRWSGYMQVKAQPSVYRLGGFTFDAPRHLLSNDKETKKLTSKEADLLLMLCENMGNTLERTKALLLICEAIALILPISTDANNILCAICFNASLRLFLLLTHFFFLTDNRSKKLHIYLRKFF